MRGSFENGMPGIRKIRIGALLAIAVLLLIYLVRDGSSDPLPTPNHVPPFPNWPPQVGEPYPDLRLRDPSGRYVRLSSFRGKVLLIEPIGLTCGACNAFVGAGKEGVTGFRGIRPQAGLAAIEDYIASHSGGVTIDHPELVYLQLLLFDTQTTIPTLEDAQAWVEHFRLDGHFNLVVLVGDERFHNRETSNMIPGFQLVDRDFILRADATGHSPKHDLWRFLLPLLGDLVQRQ